MNGNKRSTKDFKENQLKTSVLVDREDSKLHTGWKFYSALLACRKHAPIFWCMLVQIPLDIRNRISSIRFEKLPFSIAKKEHCHPVYPRFGGWVGVHDDGHRTKRGIWYFTIRVSTDERWFEPMPEYHFNLFGLHNATGGYAPGWKKPCCTIEQTTQIAKKR